MHFVVPKGQRNFHPPLSVKSLKIFPDGTTDRRHGWGRHEITSLNISLLDVTSRCYNEAPLFVDPPTLPIIPPCRSPNL